MNWKRRVKELGRLNYRDQFIPLCQRKGIIGGTRPERTHQILKMEGFNIDFPKVEKEVYRLKVIIRSRKQKVSKPCPNPDQIRWTVQDLYNLPYRNKFLPLCKALGVGCPGSNGQTRPKSIQQLLQLKKKFIPIDEIERQCKAIDLGRQKVWFKRTRKRKEEALALG